MNTDPGWAGVAQLLVAFAGIMAVLLLVLVAAIWLLNRTGDGSS